jgi:hypothetical protein
VEDRKKRSQSVPPPATTNNDNPLFENTIHSTASVDTTDSASRPTSYARQGSASGDAINHGRGMYTRSFMYNQSCLPYVSNTVIRSAVSLARGPSLLYTLF